MQQKLAVLLVLIITLLISSCVPNINNGSPELPKTTPENTVTPTSIINAGVPAYTSTNLEIIRNGKKYSIFLGYDMGEAFWYVTPRPNENLFNSDTRSVGFADIKRYGNFDNDEDFEYLVSVSGRGAIAYESLLAIDYDKVKDEYRIFDEIGFRNSVQWDDIESDGIPEIIADDEYYISQFSATVFAPLKIFHYDGEEFIGVTQTYPDLIEKDVKHWLEAIDNDAWGQGQFDSIYASYLADMYLLGKKDEGIKVFLKLCEDHYVPHIKMYNPDSTLNCDDFLLQVQDALKEHHYN